MKNFLFLVLLLFSLSTSAQLADTLHCKSGLKYIQLKEGDGVKLKTGQTAKIRYIGKLYNGEIFDGFGNGSVFMYKIGDPDFIQGWAEGLQLMSKGEKGIFIIPPFLAYGTKGATDPTEEKEYLVPPNETIIFEVEVLGVK